LSSAPDDGVSAAEVALLTAEQSDQSPVFHVGCGVT
jgi:hypothetical protein